MLEHKIAQLEERLAHARVIDTGDVDTSVVSVGSDGAPARRRREARPSSTTSSAPRRRTRPSTSSRTSRRSARRSSATRRARPSRSSTPRGVAEVQDPGDQGRLALRPERTASRAMALPKRFPDRDEIAAVRAEAEQSLEAGGRGRARDVSPRRARAWRGASMGKLVFLDLVDRSGRIQLLCPPSRVSECVDVDLGDIVGVAGLPDEDAARRAVAARRRARAAREDPRAAARHLPRPHRRRAALPPALPRPADERGDARRLPRCARGSSRRPRVTSTATASSRSRRRCCSRATAAPSPEPFVTHSQRARRGPLPARSPTELYLKRLIVGGLERVYEIGKDFRNEGVSYKHQPEFTMLEWYEAYADYRDTMARIERLVERVATDVNGGTTVTFRGHEIDLQAPWERRRLRRGARARTSSGRATRPSSARWLTERGVDDERRQGLGAARRPRVLATSSSRA